MEILVNKVAELGKLKAFDTSNLADIFISPPKIKKRIKHVSKKMKSFYMFYLPILAEHGLVGCVGDHRHIGRYQSDPEKKCFGMSAVIPDRSGRKRSFILDYM